MVLVGNKVDQVGDRMVTTEEGQRRSKEIGCVCFHEISVRESIDQVGLYARVVKQNLIDILSTICHSYTQPAARRTL